MLDTSEQKKIKKINLTCLTKGTWRFLTRMLRDFVCLLVAGGLSASCQDKVKVDVVAGPSLATIPASQLLKPRMTGLDRLVARSGEVVKISGENFKDQNDLEVSIGGKLVPVTIAPDASAEFTMPEGVSPGMGDVKLVSKSLGELGQATILADAGDYPINTLKQEEVCKDKTYRNAKGEILVGTLDCDARPLCTATLRVDCTATEDFASVPKTEIVPSSIKNGATIGGVTGIYPSSAAPLAANTPSADLTSFGPTTSVGLYEFFDSAGNVYSATILDGGTIAPGPAPQSLSSAGSLYRSVTVSGDANLLATNIKSGVSIFGRSGSVTPAPSNCTSAAQTGCVTTSTYKSMDLSQVGASSATGLTAGNFDTKLTSAANFEFWDSSGARHIKAGDSDLTSVNIKDTVVVFGVTGTAPATCTSSGQQNCLATATYYAATACAANGADNCYLNPAVSYDAADWTNLTSANIKNGASVAGLTGTYPSSGNLLAGADATADLDSSTFNAKIKSATAFEYFGPDGTRYTGAGDADINAAKILSGQDIFGAAGSVPASPANCSANGSQSCVATGTYYAATACTADSANCFVPTYVATTQPLKAISYDAIDAGKASIRSSLTLSGISGTLANCSTNNTAGCVTTAPYNSADWTNLTAANIKNGASVAGLTGTYPSSGNLLSGADGTADLDTATFDAKVKSAASFEFFGPDGTRYTGAGDADIVAANVANGVTIFGQTGTVVAAPAVCSSDGQQSCFSTSAYPAAKISNITSWDLRYGRTLAGQTGALKTNCRNTIRSVSFNYDGLLSGLGTTGYTDGTSLDFWDTVDDNFGFSSTTVTGWGAETFCDSSTWSDVTPGGACGTASVCIYQNLISNLKVTGILGAGGTGTPGANSNITNTTTPGTFYWYEAMQTCNSSTYGGYAAGSWRLPTQKELIALYAHGIVSLAGSNFMTLTNQLGNFWSASSVVNSTGAAWYQTIARGHFPQSGKTASLYVICVSP